MAQSIAAAAPAAMLPQSFLQCVGHLLTPQVWKQAHQAVRRGPGWRWQTQPLCFVLLCMTWCAGDSLPERFETARAFYVALHPRRRRPGQSFAGFEKALGKLPLPVLRALATALRGRLAQVFAARWRVDGFIPLGCDGSRLACPRAAELEQRLRLGQKPPRKRPQKGRPAGRPSAPADDGTDVATPVRAAGPPQLWVTAILHLGVGVLWSWRWGLGHADERQHLRRLIATLPQGTLLVADAAYVGYELMTGLQNAGHAFLLRLSARAPLYVSDKATLRHYCEGLVYYWPQKMQKQGLPPLPLRLWRIRGDRGAVCLITNVLDAARLPKSRASTFYRWRWRNEGLFRAYKRTLGKVKLMSRTVAQVHREAEGSLLATQLLLAQGALTLPATVTGAARLPSVRKVLLEIRAEIRNVTGMYLGPRQAHSYAQRLARAHGRARRQRTSKVRRRWPGRRDHRPPRPPKILKMGSLLKDQIDKMLPTVQVCNC